MRQIGYVRAGDSLQDLANRLGYTNLTEEERDLEQFCVVRIGLATNVEQYTDRITDGNLKVLVLREKTTGKELPSYSMHGFSLQKKDGRVVGFGVVEDGDAVVCGAITVLHIALHAKALWNECKWEKIKKIYVHRLGDSERREWELFNKPDNKLTSPK